jgi:outer membrane receptor protein involved in Fe transport
MSGPVFPDGNFSLICKNDLASDGILVRQPAGFAGPTNPRSVKTIALLRLAIAPLCAGAVATPLVAQTTPFAESAETIKLNPFAVTAEKSAGYKVSSASTATRTNTAIIDIPQTVDIVTKEFWNDIGATSFDESFRYAANVYVRNRHAGSGDGVNLRGFETNGSISVDGVRMGNYKRDLVGYERLEIVKGPPSAVQGRAGGTGLLNYILKKPDATRRGGFVRASVKWDEFDGMMTRGELDANYTLNKSGSLAARIGASIQKGEDYIKFNEFENYTAYPSLRWQIGRNTELIVANEFLNLTTPSRDEGHGFAIYPEAARRLIPRFDTSADPITALRLPYNFNLIGPNNIDKQRIAASTFFFTHQFSENLFFRQVANARYLGQDSFTYAAENNLVTNMPSQYSGFETTTQGSTAQGDLVAKFSPLGWLSSQTLVGYSYGDVDSINSNYAGIPDAPFNFLNIAAIGASGNSRAFYDGRRVSNLNRSSYTSTDSYSFGMYVQQDVGLWGERLLLTGGLRSDRDRTETTNLSTNLRTAGGDTTLNSYRYGATFKVARWLAAYAVQSVQNDATRAIQRYNGLLAGDPRANEFFTVSPYTELQEGGLKGEILGGRMSFSAAYWQMTRTGSVVNIVAPGVSQGQTVNIGTQAELQGAQSKGWELTAFGSVTDRLSLIANYTRMTTSQAFTGQQNAQGWNTTTNRPATIPLRFAPDWNANLFAKYSFRDTQEQGFEVKAGVSAIGPFYAQVTGLGLTYVPHTQSSFDAGVAYRWRRFLVDLMVTNLGNDPMLVTRDQPPRTYNLSISTTF